MIHAITLHNFRNFSDETFQFLPSTNVIIGNNGYGKTNILEALALPESFLFERDPRYFVRHGSEVFRIQYHGDF